MNALTPGALLATSSLSTYAGPDAHLLTEFAGFEQLDQQRQTMTAVADVDDSYDCDAPEYAAMTSAWHESMKRIMPMRATTPAGIRAKAFVTAALIQNHIGVNDAGTLDHASSTEEMAWSLCQDVLADGTANAERLDLADAELIAACDEHVKRMAAYNANPDNAGDSLYTAMMETHDLIMDATPQTMAGLFAKAKATKAESVDESDFTSSGTEWAWQVTMDLLRLGASA